MFIYEQLWGQDIYQSANKNRFVYKILTWEVFFHPQSFVMFLGRFGTEVEWT